MARKEEQGRDTMSHSVLICARTGAGAGPKGCGFKALAWSNKTGGGYM